jgi:hypothetical protein
VSSLAAVNQIGERAVGDDVALLAQHPHPIDVFDTTIAMTIQRAVGNEVGKQPLEV